MPSTTARFAHRDVELEDVTIHVTIGGRGLPVILLHGFAQTSRMWNPLLPLLADHYTVIAPDLPGFGDSSIPNSGLDVNAAATRIHGLAHSLGIGNAVVVGHDIGLMVAFAYAARFRKETERLVVMDAFLPGIAGWERIYNDPGLWHFRFNGPTPEALVKGRERIYLNSLWDDFAADPARSIPQADREFYAAAYARPGRMRAAWSYFAGFPRTAREFAELARRPLNMPVLALGGEKANGDVLGRQMRSVAREVTVGVLEDTGHWLMEERPRETMDALRTFLRVGDVLKAAEEEQPGAGI